MEISELQAQIEQLQYELNVENQRGGLKDAAKVESLETQIAELNKQIDEQNQAAIEASVTTEVSKFMDSLDFGGAEPKELFLNYSEEGARSSYNYVNAVIQNAVAKMKQAEFANTKALEANIVTLQANIDKLQQEKEELSHDLSVQNLEISDLNARLSNATRLLDEEKAEVERLNSRVDDLQKEIAIGAVAATKVEEIDVRSEREKWLEQRQKEEDAKPVIYNIRWKKPDPGKPPHTHYLAELAATDETIEFPHFVMKGDIEKPTAMKGKYRVVTSEEAPSFRTVTVEPQEPEHNHEDHTHDIPADEVSYTAPAFRDTEEDGTTSGLDQSDIGSEVAGKTVEERLQALELAVFGKVEVEAE